MHDPQLAVERSRIGAHRERGFETRAQRGENVAVLLSGRERCPFPPVSLNFVARSMQHGDPTLVDVWWGEVGARSLLKARRAEGTGGGGIGVGYEGGVQGPGGKDCAMSFLYSWGWRCWSC